MGQYNFSIDQFIAHYLNAISLADNGEHNFNPIILRDIGSVNQNNIVIQGKFRTDFDPEGSTVMDDGISYITVRRPLDGEQRYYHGYGLAWRPSKTSGTPNIFIVDNSDVVWEFRTRNTAENNRYRNHISAAYKDIQPDTDYYFRIVINSDNAIKVWIEEEQVDLGAADRVAVESGARIPISAYSIYNTGIGISVKNTNDSVWSYEEIFVNGYDNKYPAVAFEMTTDDLPAQFSCRYIAVGNPPADGTYGVKLYAYNYITNKWVLISANIDDDIGTASPITTQYIQKTYYTDGEGIARFIMITSDGSADRDDVAVLEIKHFSLVPRPSKEVNLGGAVDISVVDSTLTEGELSITLDGDKVVYPVFLEVPLWITKITLDEVELRHNIEYVWGYDDEKLSNTIRQKLYITFDDAYSGDVVITYLYSPALQSLGDLNNNYNVSFKGSDILVKHAALNVVTVTPNEDIVVNEIREYIESLEWYNGMLIIDYSEYMHRLREVVGQSVPAVVTIKYKDGLYMKNTVLNREGQTKSIDEMSMYWVL